MAASAYVLDSFAVLALLGREDGGDAVAEILRRTQAGEARTRMTWVNVGEVVHIVERRWRIGRVYQVLGTLEATGIEIVPVGRELALAAAHVKAQHPLAYADAFAAALAIQDGATLVTGDPEFRPLKGELAIQWIGVCVTEGRILNAKTRRRGDAKSQRDALRFAPLPLCVFAFDSSTDWIASVVVCVRRNPGGCPTVVGCATTDTTLCVLAPWRLCAFALISSRCGAHGGQRTDY